VTNFEAIASASSAMISTNIPPSEVDRFISLALKARGQKVSTVSLVPPMVVTADPDIATVRGMIDTAIARAEGRTPTKAADTSVAAPPDDAATDAPASTTVEQPAATSTQAPADPAAQPQVVTGGSVGNLSNGYAANQTDDLGASC
jgi:hypothetical protein